MNLLFFKQNNENVDRARRIAALTFSSCKYFLPALTTACREGEVFIYRNDNVEVTKRLRSN
jgi:hypothetical protein